MAARNLLAIKKLPAFKAWLDANGIENRPTGAAYQVIQVRGGQVERRFFVHPKDAPNESSPSSRS